MLIAIIMMYSPPCRSVWATCALRVHRMAAPLWEILSQEWRRGSDDERTPWWERTYLQELIKPVQVKENGPGLAPARIAAPGRVPARERPAKQRRPSQEARARDALVED